jgi:uncharacterized protein (TIGR02118 family)
VPHSTGAGAAQYRRAVAPVVGFGAMIRVSVLYPSGEGTTFDHDYYAATHIPMCIDAWNVPAQIDKGINGPYVAAVHFTFDSMEHMQSAMASEKTGAVMADVANYTNAAPVMQISEMV